MIVFPNAKINLGLNILRKRSDGYHELETCFYPVLWRDALEIIDSDKTHITTTGIELPDEGENIVLKAFHLLKKDFDLPPIRIHLHKSIPIGAGLGGGSADAAFMLKLLNEKYMLGITHNDLLKYATRLGADCAFFLENRPLLASGIGERFSELKFSLDEKHIVLVYPNIHISTKEAYSNIVPKNPSVRIKDVLENHPIENWEGLLTNDFEAPLFKKYPILKNLKEQLYDSGGVYASMSGSGSCMFGIFDRMPALSFPDDFKIWAGGF
ncbi:MAG: 4-(cytidine 5'-diphospho)-2-C-methyl-D-erythritol kinase [Cytophagales bacterium]|nr:4-(cytidine 5'-diphospho)-2-C-methyl-D-erythritol kinase [Cytophagales bacterium]